jgi:hypothetical protein
MMDRLSSRAWTYQTSHAGEGAQKSIELGREAIGALAAAVGAIDQNQATAGEFTISRGLTLVCEPSRLALVNCEARFPFASLSTSVTARKLISRIFTRHSPRTAQWRVPSMKLLSVTEFRLFAVVFYEFPVRIHLKSRLFTVRLDEHFTVPPAIGIVFP